MKSARNNPGHLYSKAGRIAKIIVSLAVIYHLWFLISTNLPDSSLRELLIRTTGTFHYGSALGFMQAWGMFTSVPASRPTRVELKALIDGSWHPVPATWPRELPLSELNVRIALMTMVLQSNSNWLPAYLARAGEEARARFGRCSAVILTYETNDVRDLNLIRQDGRSTESVVGQFELRLWATGSGRREVFDCEYPKPSLPGGQSETDFQRSGDSLQDYLHLAADSARERLSWAQSVNLELVQKGFHRSADGHLEPIAENARIVGTITCRP